MTLFALILLSICATAFSQSFTIPSTWKVRVFLHHRSFFWDTLVQNTTAVDDFTTRLKRSTLAIDELVPLFNPTTGTIQSSYRLYSQRPFDENDPSFRSHICSNGRCSLCCSAPWPNIWERRIPKLGPGLLSIHIPHISRLPLSLVSWSILYWGLCLNCSTGRTTR